MFEHPTQKAFDLITKGLTEKDVELLGKLMGKMDREKLINNLFSNLRTYNAVYKFPSWESLTISEQKETINLDIKSWYTNIVLINPEFAKGWAYSTEDKERLEIVVKGLGLVDYAGIDKYLKYLINKRNNASGENFSVEYKEWLKDLIEDARIGLQNYQKKIQDKWEPLRHGMIKEQYFTNTQKELFFYVMEFHKLPANESRINMGIKMRKTYAVHFSDKFQFSNLGEFMKCFNIEVGPHDRSNTDPPKNFTDLYDLAP